jgi:hypothetical protein
LKHLQIDEVRLSNLIPKDTFSVNPVNNEEYIGLSVEEYNYFFQEICNYYSTRLTLIENEKTLGFVKYVLIPDKLPIILNWNTSSTVSEQICENDIENRQINTFKCLVDGDISLSWNSNNKIYFKDSLYRDICEADEVLFNDIIIKSRYGKSDHIITLNEVLSKYEKQSLNNGILKLQLKNENKKS